MFRPGLECLITDPESCKRWAGLLLPIKNFSRVIIQIYIYIAGVFISLYLHRCSHISRFSDIHTLSSTAAHMIWGLLQTHRQSWCSNNQMNVWDYRTNKHLGCRHLCRVWSAQNSPRLVMNCFRYTNQKIIVKHCCLCGEPGVSIFMALRGWECCGNGDECLFPALIRWFVFTHSCVHYQSLISHHGNTRRWMFLWFGGALVWTEARSALDFIRWVNKEHHWKKVLNYLLWKE